MGYYYDTPPPPFVGGRQPHEPHKLSPDILPVNDPPFMRAAWTVRHMVIVSLAQPERWPYPFTGRAQPYNSRQNAPGVPGQSGNDPPFTLGGPVALKSEMVAIAQPDPWTYMFLGASQPYGPMRRSSAIPGQSVDIPISSTGGPFALKLLAVALNQPDWSYTAWPYIFAGAAQPYAPRRLPPVITAVAVNNPPFTHASRTPAQMAIRTSWNPPPPDYQMQLYASRPTPQRLRVFARGYIIL